MHEHNLTKQNLFRTALLRTYSLVGCFHLVVALASFETLPINLIRRVRFTIGIDFDVDDAASAINFAQEIGSI